MLSGRTPLPPGGYLLENYATVLGSNVKAAGTAGVGMMLWNSLVTALMIAVGKIAIPIIAVHAIVSFRLPLCRTCVRVVFSTLMLPAGARILPTFGVVASLDMLNSCRGLSVPRMVHRFGSRIWSPQYSEVTAEALAAARSQGLRVVVWTVNGVREMQATARPGVDGIVTDHPDLAMAALAPRRQEAAQAA